MVSAPLILSLETATMGGSVFVGRGKLQLATRNGDPQVSQSNSLLSDIDNTLREAGISLQDVDLLACASGPGSFTGLRIGIATLKGLAATLGRPCAGIPTLKSVAHSAGPSSATVALLPAGRGELFAQLFSVSEDEKVADTNSAAHLSPEKLVEKYASFKNLTWAGPGAHQQRELIEGYASQLGITFGSDSTNVSHSTVGVWRLAPMELNLARHVAALALQLFERGEVQSADTLRAIYVRPSDAELKEQCR